MSSSNQLSPWVGIHQAMKTLVTLGEVIMIKGVKESNF